MTASAMSGIRWATTQMLLQKESFGKTIKYPKGILIATDNFKRFIMNVIQSILHNS